MSVQTILIVRHGNRQDFVDPAWKGVDPPLSEDGIVQAQETGVRLCGEGISRIFASPFYRTVQTAHQIAEALDLPVNIEPGACEWLNPEWFAEMPSFIRPARLRETFPRIDPVFPESPEQMKQRCHKAITRLAAVYPSDILVVGHGASVVGMTQGLAGNRDPVHCGLCALVKVRREGDRVDLELNGDTSHLSGGDKHRNRLV
jgi:broad specificity phosphatase PhoE